MKSVDALPQNVPENKDDASKWREANQNFDHFKFTGHNKSVMSFEEQRIHQRMMNINNFKEISKQKISQNFMKQQAKLNDEVRKTLKLDQKNKSLINIINV